MTRLLKSYAPLPIDVDYAEDVWVVDIEGRRYLDLYAGHAVASTGHCHPEVVRAIQEQASRLIFYSNAVRFPLREEAAERLMSYAPEPLAQVFFANSGAEANENALKLARRHTGRTKVVAMHGGFHGRTAGAVSVTGVEKYREQSLPLVPGAVFIEFGNLAAASAAIDDTTAAVILEPIQSMAGVKTAPPDYYRGLRSLCDRHRALLIYDEVQTGIGRTGTMFFAGLHGVVPDLVTLAKGIASGIPLSALLISKAVAEKVQFGEYGSTFGAGPVAMAAMKATLDVIEDENLLENVTVTGSLMKSALLEVPGVGEVRGQGFLAGVKTGADVKRLQKALLAKGVIVGTADEPGVLRLLPPLTLRPSHVTEFVRILKEVLAHELQGAAFH